MNKILLSLPVIGKFLAGRPMLLKVVENIGWLSVDKFIRLVLAFFVNVWMVRYLGPTGYGSINYAVAFLSFFSIFVNLGMDGVVVRELVNQPEKRDSILGTAFLMRLMGAGVGIVLALLVSFVVNREDAQSTWFIFILSLGFVFQSFLVIDYYFQSQIKAKYFVFAQNIAVFVVTGFRVLLLLTKAPVVWFVVALVLEGMIGTIFLVFFYLKNGLHFKHWHFEKERALLLIRSCWPLMLSSVAIMIYMRIDQVMIKKMLGVAEVGLYSAAVILVEVFYFLPGVIADSVFPAIVEAKKIDEKLYETRMRQLYTLLIWGSILVALPIALLSDVVVGLIYGDNYRPTVGVLKIYVWALVFVSLGVAGSKWLLIEHLEKYSLYRTIMGVLSNIGLNLIFIPKWGIYGATVATVVSQTVTGYLSELFSSCLRRNFILKTEAILGKEIIKFLKSVK